MPCRIFKWQQPHPKPWVVCLSDGIGYYGFRTWRQAAQWLRDAGW